MARRARPMAMTCSQDQAVASASEALTEWVRATVDAVEQTGRERVLVAHLLVEPGTDERTGLPGFRLALRVEPDAVRPEATPGTGTRALRSADQVEQLRDLP